MRTGTAVMGGRGGVSFMGSGGTDPTHMVMVCTWDVGWVCSGRWGANGKQEAAAHKKLRSQESF